MVVRVLLFGPHAAAAGRGMVEVSLPDQSTCAALRDGLESQYPALRPLLGSSRVALNQRFAAPDAAITPRDEVALIGLVSGG
jgi:molybdopterin converting factor small subunit